ncbi:4Fe-4S binding protein [Candidatus Aminicenantes bacterium AC-335-A11]|jgi:NAD-dependent dihydropyrimidine dehydrogenase PreA subunit|nr:4Fe-4S binding protein [SCandidatus Aminicenantes bacterium Aminicenantia_JdfR_composite]MCP2597312.1 4Fe-4S binding protein [Candidatus Aminicenantes bacterium AC-335-G13]MCP2598106.1 4Fe-4S binding protein [Candidatus Aminicenantes bacterium AC-335-L06]MCP2618030.1 4Fe-4S binding protein [Candidatus Aminicenantes bacterium AC-335-A11]
MKTLTKVKIGVPFLISLIIFIAQIIHSIIKGFFYTYHFPIFISYSLIVGLIGYFLIDFITATGHLRRKIQFVKLLILYFIFLILMNNLINSYQRFFISESQLILTVLISILFIILDNFLKPEQDFDFITEIKQLPKKYLRPHPFRTILETIFRLFPLPEPIALYKVNNPNRNSPVIITGNYELTVRRVAKALQELNCWFLVCDSRGINVWCSSLSGHFSEKNIIHAIELTNLSKYISHKKIILPQLCAPGVNIQLIRQKTGFSPIFGPVYIEYIKDFLNKNKKESELRKVRFDFRQRIEMAISSPIILANILAFIYLFIDLSKYLLILPIIYFIALIHAIIYPYRPIKKIPLWALLYSLCTAGIIISFFLLFHLFNFTWSIGITITIGIGIFYLINEFEGWSPLVKYNLKSIYKGVKPPNIKINEEFCTGCELCFQVCPGGVFIIENNKAKVLDTKKCINCSACYKQCPAKAILHSSDRREKDRCSCAYCELQNSLRE